MSDFPEMRYVTWLDSKGADGWAERDEVAEHAPGLIETVGFVVVDTDTHLTLTLALTDDRDCGAFMVIPKCAIRASCDVVLSEKSRSGADLYEQAKRDLGIDDEGRLIDPVAASKHHGQEPSDD